jgi:hypothetical protein
VKRYIATLVAVLALAGCASSHQQSMTQSYAYKYGKTLGSIAYIETMVNDGKAAAGAQCQMDFGNITSSFVPTADLVEFPEWKKSGVKQHVGWFFLGLKAGCK